MKVIHVVCALLLTQHLITCDIAIESLWKNLETRHEEQLFDGKWILTAIITFKKHPDLKDPITLSKLYFAWQGPFLHNLTASLYRKIPNQAFVPLEELLVCDGRWNERNQELYFNFDEPHKLDPLTKFYIVITIPDHLSSILRNGSFLLIPTSLPDIIQNFMNIKSEDYDHDEKLDNNMLIGLSFTVNQKTSMVKNYHA